MECLITPVSRLTLIRAAAALLTTASILFFPETGTFSDDILAVPKLDLWNAIIGAG
jgi:hypothetical protein